VLVWVIRRRRMRGRILVVIGWGGVWDLIRYLSNFLK
jgi:hypothetical protein